MSDDIKAKAKKEERRIKGLLSGSGVSATKMKLLEPIILNTAWMKAKLDDARDAIKSSNIVITYDNGGGQKGLRENPLFKGYENLWRSYMAGMNRIMDSLPDEVVRQVEEEAEQPKTMLELIRNKHKREA
ncbi:MAG: hypothetical protein J6U56_05185 [Spirochaetia bacterium]|nr:hypothetical protein [Spirochaetia bacterium]